MVKSNSWKFNSKRDETTPSLKSLNIDVLQDFLLEDCKNKDFFFAEEIFFL